MQKFIQRRVCKNIMKKWISRPRFLRLVVFHQWVNVEVLRKGYFIINGYSITIIMFFYPYNQRYRVYLKGEKKKQDRWYRCRPSGETTKEIQFLVARLGRNREEKMRWLSLRIIVPPLGPFSLITKRQGWRTSVYNILCL